MPQGPPAPRDLQPQGPGTSQHTPSSVPSPPRSPLQCQDMATAPGLSPQPRDPRGSAQDPQPPQSPPTSTGALPAPQTPPHPKPRSSQPPGHSSSPTALGGLSASQSRGGGWGSSSVRLTPSGPSKPPPGAGCAGSPQPRPRRRRQARVKCRHFNGSRSPARPQEQRTGGEIRPGEGLGGTRPPQGLTPAAGCRGRAATLRAPKLALGTEGPAPVCAWGRASQQQQHLVQCHLAPRTGATGDATQPPRCKRRARPPSGAPSPIFG